MEQKTPPALQTLGEALRPSRQELLPPAPPTRQQRRHMDRLAEKARFHDQIGAKSLRHQNPMPGRV